MIDLLRVMTSVPLDCAALPQTFMGGDLYTKPIVCYESGESTATTHHGIAAGRIVRGMDSITRFDQTIYRIK